MEKKLNVAKDQYNSLLLEYNQSKNELMETKGKLHKAGDNIYELKKIRKRFNYQNTRVTKLESKLNEKTKNVNALKKYIDDLNNTNIEILIEKNKFYQKKKKEIDALKEINYIYNQKIQKLEKELKEHEEYFNDYEKNRIETQEKIKDLNRLNNKLNEEELNN